MAKDDVIQKQGTSKWLWVGVIVVLAIAAVIIFLNANGDEPELAGDRESALEDDSSTAAKGDAATAPADMIEEPVPNQSA